MPLKNSPVDKKNNTTLSYTEIKTIIVEGIKVETYSTSFNNQFENKEEVIELLKYIEANNPNYIISCKGELLTSNNPEIAIGESYICMDKETFILLTDCLIDKTKGSYLNLEVRDNKLGINGRIAVILEK